ncbi:glycosyltransferase [Dactylosporangium vinaceum]|uniref:Glycosyltransferase n=1 Tax=Dactylosporangium vinaceum TaxID=53362 RepID=A0ABV5MAC4_9ACTN|nr:nucleotide disphospho-sugar-binding domain-containing protein [Dactylosporangium vinaceum]UAB93033.1 glycosyltransferase [Dactylosporangium vinaceum]
MRVLFTAVPIHGHLLPLLPLAQAVAAAGDDAAFAGPASLGALIGDVPLLVTSPEIAELLAENGRRTGGADMAENMGAVAELFAGTLVDVTYDRTLRRAREFGADVVVADEYDTVGPMVAAALGVPLVRHAIGLPVSPPPLRPAMDVRLAPRYAARGIRPPRRIALVDPWPPGLQGPQWTPAPDRLAIRPVAYAGTEAADVPALRGGVRVLVTLGTVLLDGAMLDALVDAVAGLDNVDVLAAVPPGVPHALEDPRAHVRFVGFVPMAQLLAADVAVVVAAGGAGTVLAALAHGLPMVLWPKGAEKPMNAERVAAAGAGIVIDDAGSAHSAVLEVLTSPLYRTGAARIAEQIRTAPPAGAVWALLRERIRKM